MKKRLQFDVTQEQKERIERAAKIDCRTVRNFNLAAALEKADRIIDEEQRRKGAVNGEQ